MVRNLLPKSDSQPNKLSKHKRTMKSTSPEFTVEQVWKKYDATEQRLTAPVSNRMLELASLQSGMRVLDLATGRGEPAIRAAHQVGPTGTVVGIDSSETMLAMARKRAQREGVANLELHTLPSEALPTIHLENFDAILIRWGLMYMDSPVAALTAARHVLVPHGSLVAALWAEPERVPYYTFPRKVLAASTPVVPIDLNEPGTFRYSDLNTIHHDFAQAGFTIQHVEEMDIPVMEAKTKTELVAWTRAFGMNRLLRYLPENVQESWEIQLRKEADRFQDQGFFRLGGITRIIVATPTKKQEVSSMNGRR
jgi:ubiquinone/menaquinone biosynthesis C-methylase UbiE